jgi:F-box-like
VLPDDVLLEIFDFYVFKYLVFRPSGGYDAKRKIESWQSLVHVCRRWRGLVLGSPRRLILQLCYTPRVSASRTLDVWPALPLIILGDVPEASVNNVIAELKHSDRICQISLDFHTTSQIEKLWTAMQVPFPELTVLCLSFEGLPRWYVPPLPDSFLGGSAPHLRCLYLHTIPFPGIPKLLLSATHLVTLYLHNIPHSRYISPEAMVTCLSILTNLEILHLLFTSSQSRPDQENRRSPPPTRSILPALTKFSFEGINEYLEDLVSWIDSPRLYQFWTTFFYDIEFDTPEFIQFVGRTLTFGAPIEAHVVFGSFIAWVGFGPQASHPEASHFEVGIICSEQDWLLLSLARICTLSLPPLSMTESLFIREKVHTQPDWRDGIECTEWLELLLPFTAVKDLYLSKQFAPRIAPALQELAGGRRTEVLPTLQNLFLEGFQPPEPVQDGIAQFISARRLTNRPVAISVWERDLEQEALYN